MTNKADSLFQRVSKLSRNGLLRCRECTSSKLQCISRDAKYYNSGTSLVALSGSGNSSNIINGIKKAKDLKMKSVAILAFSGGQCKELADLSICFPVDDMQIAEDTQLIIGHLCMQWLNSHKPGQINGVKNG